jgi:hypothetical protein
MKEREQADPLAAKPRWLRDVVSSDDRDAPEPVYRTVELPSQPTSH